MNTKRFTHSGESPTGTRPPSEWWFWLIIIRNPQWVRKSHRNRRVHSGTSMTEIRTTDQITQADSRNTNLVPYEADSCINSEVASPLLCDGMGMSPHQRPESLSHIPSSPVTVNDVCCMYFTSRSGLIPNSETGVAAGASLGQPARSIPGSECLR